MQPIRGVLTFPGGASPGQQQPERRPSQPALRPLERAAPAPAPAPAPASFEEPPLAASAPPSPVAVSFEVPDCHLQYGECLRVVGSSAELGAWEPSAAPALSWHEGDRWAGQLALTPGQHDFKLVVDAPNGNMFWENGPDRSLRVPELPAISSSGSDAGDAGSALRVTGRFGDTASTTVKASRVHLQVRVPLLAVPVQLQRPAVHGRGQRCFVACLQQP